MTSPSDRRPLGLLGFFLLLHVLNQVDRNLIASFGPEIVADLRLTHTQFGIVTGIAFTGVYALFALGAGVMADRFGRTRVMAAGLAIWSAFTALSGLATRFAALVAIRPLVAAGEATLIPTATAILSERFSDARRATAIGIFFVGVPLGIGVGFLIAGWLGPLIGWRGAFVALGFLGVLLVPLVLRLQPAALPLVADDAPEPPRRGREILLELMREVRHNIDLRLCVLGGVLMHVYLAGTPFVKLWLAEAAVDRAEDFAGTYGLFVIFFGILGAFSGGTLADRFAHRVPGGRASVLACFVLCLAPFILGFRLAEPGSPLFYAGMAAGILFFSAFYGPSFAVLQSVVPPHLRASVTGLTMLLVNVFALGLGSVAIGGASDALAAAGATQPLFLPLIMADAVSLLSLVCFAVIGWRAARSRASI